MTCINSSVSTLYPSDSDNGAPLWHSDNGAPIRHCDNGAPLWHSDNGAPLWHCDNGAPIRHCDNGALSSYILMSIYIFVYIYKSSLHTTRSYVRTHSVGRRCELLTILSQLSNVCIIKYL